MNERDGEDSAYLTRALVFGLSDDPAVSVHGGIGPGEEGFCGTHKSFWERGQMIRLAGAEMGRS